MPERERIEKKTWIQKRLDEMVKELRSMGNDVVMSILDKYKREGLFDN